MSLFLYSVAIQVLVANEVPALKPKDVKCALSGLLKRDKRRITAMAEWRSTSEN
jgi:hypothetical protein